MDIQSKSHSKGSRLQFVQYGRLDVFAGESDMRVSSGTVEVCGEEKDCAVLLCILAVRKACRCDSGGAGERRARALQVSKFAESVVSKEEDLCQTCVTRLQRRDSKFHGHERQSHRCEDQYRRSLWVRASMMYILFTNLINM